MEELDTTAWAREEPTATLAEAEEDTMGEKKGKGENLVDLTVGFYLVNGRTHELHRCADGSIFRADRRFEAQRELRKLNPHEWAILEVTANNFAWGRVAG